MTPTRTTPKRDTYMAVDVRPHPVRPRACRGPDGEPKAKWRTKKEATAYLRTHVGKRYRRSRDWGHMHVYRCPYCKWWHTGHYLENDG